MRKTCVEHVQSLCTPKRVHSTVATACGKNTCLFTANPPVLPASFHSSFVRFQPVKYGVLPTFHSAYKKNDTSYSYINYLLVSGEL